jgi:hypothetical protein
VPQVCQAGGARHQHIYRHAFVTGVPVLRAGQILLQAVYDAVDQPGTQLCRDVRDLLVGHRVDAQVRRGGRRDGATGPIGSPAITLSTSTTGRAHSRSNCVTPPTTQTRSWVSVSLARHVGTVVPITGRTSCDTCGEDRRSRQMRVPSAVRHRVAVAAT